jgi:hypothetical protein
MAEEVQHDLKVGTVPTGMVPNVTDLMILNIKGGIRVSGSQHCT